MVSVVLQVDLEGLALLKSFQTPVAPVVVIGPYRSGKSFLLNQLLSVPCDEGFGVGHTRNTQTKGIWVWSNPESIYSQFGWNVSVLYVDTEGFEGTGMSDTYDDRIFALSAIMSSLLIYNLPETVRESDIQKLSFAIELSSGLYNTRGSSKVRLPFEPGNMLWLIQRDFLEGKTVQEMLSSALAPVANTFADKDIDQINRIRSSLSIIAKNSTAFGLRQPHLERTKLCSMEDEDLDATYVQQRESLHRVVHQLATPKIYLGKVMMGRDLADLVERVVKALNDREIPTGGSILDNYNLELVHIAVSMYAESLSELQLPMSDDNLLLLHMGFMRDAIDYYAMHRFGGIKDGERGLEGELEQSIEREFSALQMNNTIKSTEICDDLESDCEERLEELQEMKIPSKNRFEGEYKKCRQNFESKCVGPALEKQSKRLGVAWERQQRRFTQNYNSRLYKFMIVFSLVDIVLARFVLKFQIAEVLGWFVFLFLEGYPQFIGSSETMYASGWWQALVSIWEFVAYNAITQSWAWISILFAVSVGLWRIARLHKLRRSKKAKLLGKDLDV